MTIAVNQAMDSLGEARISGYDLVTKVHDHRDGGVEALIDLDNRDPVAVLNAEGIEVDERGSPALHELPLFIPDRFPVVSWPRAALDPKAFPAAERYNRGTLSLPTLTGPMDEPRLDDTVRCFSETWKNLQHIQKQ